MEKKKHTYCGKCMFCTSVCPECGKTDVEVTGDIHFYYHNAAQDEIELEIELETIDLYCNTCSADMIGGSLLEKLKTAIDNALPDSIIAKWKDDKVTCEANYVHIE